MVDASRLAHLLPLEFHTPPRWPAPTTDWVAGHLGWQPEPGWTPTPECPPAPAGWVFWHRHEGAWEEYALSYTAPARRSLWTGLLVLGAGVVLTSWLVAPGALAGLSIGPAAGLVVGVGVGVLSAAMLWGIVVIIRAGRRMDRINAALMDTLRENAPRVKVELDRLAYENYLRSFRAPS